MVKAAWFKRYEARERPQHSEPIVQSWDTANEATELSDFSVCTTWGIAGKDLYLVDLLRRRMEYPEPKREVHAQYERFRPSVVLIEDKASGTQQIQESIAEGLYAVTRYRRNPTRSRALGVAKANACRVRRSPARSPEIASPRACMRRPR